VESEMMGCKEIQETFKKKEVPQIEKIIILPRPQPKQIVEGRDKDSMEWRAFK
jgi:hypothetical protein